MAGEQDILKQISKAGDLAMLEHLRVAALGKSGSITALLKSLGSMDAATRAAEGPKIHALREAVTAAIASRKAELEGAELDKRLATEHLDLSLPAPEAPEGSVHPPGDGRAGRDFRRPGVRRRRRAGDRGAMV
jgi:phenylalanyl-tRNA synthetase alpha chain